MSTTNIEWTDRTWNPTRGCSIVSPGCVNCYAMKQAHRFSGYGRPTPVPGQAPPYYGLTKMTKAVPQWTGKVISDETKLLEPLSWQKPSRVFVNSMSDLFHEDVPDEFIDRVFAVMALCQQHTFQVLTKRPDRMLRYCRSDDSTNKEYEPDLDGEAFRDAFIEGAAQAIYAKRNPGDDPSMWLSVHQPLRNVWLGVSVENQETADARIPVLLQTPAAVRFISAEPLLGPTTIARWLRAAVCDHPDEFCEDVGCRGETWLDWVIVGGESGPGARPFDLAWARPIVQQCQAAKVACFVKQFGAKPHDTSGFTAAEVDIMDWPISLSDRKGGDPEEWPEDLRVREFPRVEVPA